MSGEPVLIPRRFNHDMRIYHNIYEPTNNTSDITYIPWNSTSIYHKPLPYNKPLPAIKPKMISFTDGKEDDDDDISENDIYEAKMDQIIDKLSLINLRRNSAPHIETPVSNNYNTNYQNRMNINFTNNNNYQHRRNMMHQIGNASEIIVSKRQLPPPPPKKNKTLVAPMIMLPNNQNILNINDNDAAKPDKKVVRKRRNSDTIVYTPTASTVIDDYSFMENISQFSPPITHRRSKYTYDNLPKQINVNAIDLNIVHDAIVEEESDETPSPTDNVPVSFHESKKEMEMEMDTDMRDYDASQRYEETVGRINTMLRFDNNEGWDFDNEYVKVYYQQCNNINYNKLVPALKDVMYPTMLSSLALPLTSKQKQYIITVKYNISNLIKNEYIKDGNTYDTQLLFESDTTVKIAVTDLLSQIKCTKEHEPYRHLLDKLNVNCFILKVCGREEYLKNDRNSNHIKIMSLSFLRNEIRQNHCQCTQTRQHMYNASLVLLYDRKLIEYDSKKYRAYSSAHTTRNKAALSYQYKGYYCIGNTIKETINDNQIKESLNRLNEDISNEILYLQNKIPSICNAGAQTSVAVDTPTFSNVSNNLNGQITDIEWNKIESEVVRLSEFDHDIVFSIKALKNITVCPRIRQKQYAAYFTYILRIELMFGAEVFAQCSWDVRIPTALLSDHIKMPKQHCTFSTKNTGLYYSCLPREAIWCFTLYGIKKNVSAEQQLQKKEKQKSKKQKKQQPKILRFMAIDAKEKDNIHRNSQHISAKTVSDTDGFIGDSDINDFYQRRPETTRSMPNVPHTFNEEEEDKEQIYHSEAIAFVKLPMVSSSHRLIKGEHNLHMWPVPVFKHIKGGPKIDPYSTNTFKKFGSVRECQLKRNNKINSVILTINFALNYKFDIVAPIVNMRRPHYIRRQIKAYDRVTFPSQNILYDIIQRDGIFPLDERDKMLIYSNKEKLMRDSSNIPTFLRSVKWLDMESRMEAYDYLERWDKPSNPEDMIELLRYEFADNRIRLYAINCLNKLDDYTLSKSCLLQLVQALKYELHHESFLSTFLIIRALNKPFQIGHYLYYHLKSEYDLTNNTNMWFAERYGLLLEKYLKHLPYYPLYPSINLTKQLLKQHNLINQLRFISLFIQNYRKSKRKFNKKNLTNLLHNRLIALNGDIFESFDNEESTITLPLNPSIVVGQLKVTKCKFMSSAKMPLWLVFKNGDRNDMECDIETMFKCGDDLRQDILTLQLISIMDSFWLKKNINLNMKTYQVLGTGYNVGFIELVLQSKTTNVIGSLSKKSHLKYISNKSNDKQLSHENYSRSVAGFSVATWTLGIGDRHPDNIMIHENGTLFHIDFGHFLGNFKEKDIGLMTWKREKTPFVFTKCMKYCIENGGDSNSNCSSNQKQINYAQFVRWLFAAFIEIRIRYKFLLNLLLLMVPSQMPELMTESDVSFFREVLRFDLNDHESIASHVENTLKFCLADKNKKIDDMFHKIKHSKIIK